jgi:adhesin transport system outer membrane protein
MAAPLGVAIAGSEFTIFNAIDQAVTTHPGVGEATANRRATEAELRQTQGTLLPQVRLEARTGRNKFDFKDSIVPPQGNDQWLNSKEASVVVRQILFDGFASINEIWRQSARVDAAAYRVRERTELLALDAAEAYIDVVRYMRLIALANENVAAHRTLLGNVDARFQGGRAGEGDLQQVRERVEAALAVQAQFRQQYDEARGAFRRAVGIEPYNLRTPGRLGGLPSSKDQALAVALRGNPTIQAAQADSDAAKHGFDATAGAFVPTITFEGRSLWGRNTGTTFGERTDTSANLVASWDIFRGGQDAWRRVEQSERYQEQSMRHARLQRGAFESIDKAWAARTITSDRIAALRRQIGADRRVIEAYQKEYELGQRSLIDLLNAQNQLFNASVSLQSTLGVAVFADYQLLAAMGKMLDYLKAPKPIDAEPLPTRPFGIIPMKLPPIILQPPGPGSEPINIGKRSDLLAPGGIILTQQRAAAIDSRWPELNAVATTAQQWLGLDRAVAATSPTPDKQPAAETPVMSFAPSIQPSRPSLLFPKITSLFQ